MIGIEKKFKNFKEKILSIFFIVYPFILSNIMSKNVVFSQFISKVYIFVSLLLVLYSIFNILKNYKYFNLFRNSLIMFLSSYILLYNSGFYDKNDFYNTIFTIIRLFILLLIMSFFNQITNRKYNYEYEYFTIFILIIVISFLFMYNFFYIEFLDIIFYIDICMIILYVSIFILFCREYFKKQVKEFKFLVIYLSYVGFYFFIEKLYVVFDLYCNGYILFNGIYVLHLNLFLNEKKFITCVDSNVYMSFYNIIVNHDIFYFDCDKSFFSMDNYDIKLADNLTIFYLNVNKFDAIYSMYGEKGKKDILKNTICIINEVLNIKFYKNIFDDFVFFVYIDNDDERREIIEKLHIKSIEISRACEYDYNISIGYAVYDKKKDRNGINSIIDRAYKNMYLDKQMMIYNLYEY